MVAEDYEIKKKHDIAVLDKKFTLEDNFRNVNTSMMSKVWEDVTMNVSMFGLKLKQMKLVDYIFAWVVGLSILPWL